MCTTNRLDHDISETSRSEIDTRTSDVCGTERICKKCGCEQVRVSLKRKGAYCETCFLSLTVHKFRATLGKSKSVHPKDSILIGYSGKAASTVLVDLVKASGNESLSKRLALRCKILYIDDGMVKGRTARERELIRMKLLREAEKMQFPMYVVSLASCLNGNAEKEIHSIREQKTSVLEEDAIIEEMFRSLQDDTARDQLLSQLTRRLLVLAARNLDCNKIFVSDTSMDIAVKVLGDVSTGRGSQLFPNVTFSDTRSADVALLRPLRDFTEDEVVNYLDCYGLTAIFHTEKYNEFFPASIRAITKEFLHRLNSEFHSTVSTICRTSEKMAAKTEKLVDDESDVGDDVCMLCELPLEGTCDQREEQLSVVRATIFSKLVSTSTDYSLSDVTVHLPNAYDIVNDSKAKQCCSVPCHNSPLQYQAVEKHFCYGCKSIFLNSNQSLSLLPDFILNRIRKKLHLIRLQKEIKDFLL